MADDTNAIKDSGEGVAVQATIPARNAGLVEENAEGDASYLAEVRVYSFDGVLLVADRDPRRIGVADVADLAGSLLRDTESIYQAVDATTKISGHGYQIQLPPAADAGFHVGDVVKMHTAPNVLVVTKRGRNKRLADDIVDIRRSQVA